MSKSKLHLSLRSIGTTFVLLGASIACIGSTPLSAELLLQNQEHLLPAASEPSNAIALVAFGMLMVLIGMGLHALWILRKRDAAPANVPITIRKHKNRTTRKQMEVIWVERTIRL